MHAAIIDAHPTGGFPFNTDGFGVQGSRIRIAAALCTTATTPSPSHDIAFERNTIGFQSHGMSIGSLGKKPTDPANITNLRFEDVTVVDALYVARFKFWVGGSGLVKNVVWKNIRVHKVTFPIFVTKSYWDQGATRPGTVDPSSSVMMEDFTWSDFSGSINTFQPGDESCVSHPCWYNNGLANLNHTEQRSSSSATPTPRARTSSRRISDCTRGARRRPASSTSRPQRS